MNVFTLEPTKQTKAGSHVCSLCRSSGPLEDMESRSFYVPQVGETEEGPGPCQTVACQLP